jgi:nucleoside-diphosphate-sugar epimerase
MRVFVTGAGGFLGHAVLSRGVQLHHEMRVHVGPPGFHGIRPGPDVPTVHADIEDVDALRSLAARADVVVHLAGPAAVAASFDEAAEYLRVHVLGTEATVRLCRVLDAPRLVYVSSAEVYGQPSRSPVPEDAPLRPRSPYGAAKVGAEGVVGAAVRAHGLDAVVLRPFSVYGPGMRPGSVIGTVLTQALAGDEVQLFATRVVRDFCLVDDVAEAVWAACTTVPPRTGLRVYNVGSGRGTSMAELARTVFAVLDRSGRVTQRAGQDRPAAADIVELVADVAAARRDLGWQARTPLPIGLRRTLDWWKAAAAHR